VKTKWLFKNNSMLINAVIIGRIFLSLYGTRTVITKAPNKW
jgi:hypothetical protein